MAKQIAAADVKKIVIACEAGMGSSLMVTNKLKKKVKAAGLDMPSATPRPGPYPRMLKWWWFIKG